MGEYGESGRMVADRLSKDHEGLDNVKVPLDKNQFVGNGLFHVDAGADDGVGDV